MPVSPQSLKLLVTGGAGFIGSHLVEALIARGHQVVIFDNLRNGSLDNLQGVKSHPGYRFVQGDILSQEDLPKALIGVNAVFHLACLGVRHSIHSPLENHRVNAEGTLNVLNAARQAGAGKFFYISSSEIYGAADNFPLHEKVLPQPMTVYGAGKLAGEHYTNAFQRTYGLDTMVLRIFNNYGPRAHYEGDCGEMIPRSIIRILNGQKPVIFGDGTQTRDFFYVKDTACALADLLVIKRFQGQTINIGTGIEINMKDLLNKMLKLMGQENLGIEFMESRVADVPRLWVNADKFYALTGFQPKYTFEEGLKITIEYYKDLQLRKNLIEQIKIKNWEK
jgi:UDP-glucose 4-epimerase